jgi:hypothetical protein
MITAGLASKVLALSEKIQTEMFRIFYSGEPLAESRFTFDES